MLIFTLTGAVLSGETQIAKSMFSPALPDDAPALTGRCFRLCHAIHSHDGTAWTAETRTVNAALYAGHKALRIRLL
jgi:hypothetical protein